jgi:hypothetical protein
MSNSHEKPILFSTEMVEAIIKGNKTETRRTRGLEEINKNPNDWANIDIQWGIDKCYISAINRKSGEILDIKCPYGTIHTKIWIRETWALLDFLVHDQEGIVYKASEIGKDWEANDEAWTWKPSIHMSKKYARIWLRIESIGIDRLKNITKEEAIAEGIQVLENDVQYSYKDYLSNQVYYFDPRNSFESIWDSINGEGAWDFNPWVWVIKFSKLKNQ